MNAAVVRRSPRWLPFAALNLKRNPFGELTGSERAAAAVVDVGHWARRLIANRRAAVQFIGACGRGKSTHLLALAARLPGAAYVYLPEDGPLPTIPSAPILLIDEAQRLSWLLRRRVFQRGATLVLGTHCDLSPALVRSGYIVETAPVAEATTPQRIRAIVNRRIELARLNDGPTPQATVADARALFDRFGGDLRGLEHSLYERFQRHAFQNYGQVRLVD